MAITKTPTRSYDHYPDYDSSCSSSIATTIPDSTRTSFSLSSSNNLDVAHSNSQNTTTHHNKPHKANQAGWEAMKHLRSSQKGGRLGLEHFKLVHRVGSGDIGSVYLCQLRNYSPQSGGYYAMKVVDREALAIRNKLQRAEMEKEILGMLDHPFLPTLYAEFDTSHYSCLVMEYCPGGDLHAARQRQPGKRFSISSSKFYAAEALLALEYLHMMGIVYRDLKPENVLVREDGHIMLSDFDLSLKCDVVPKLLRTQTRNCHRSNPSDNEGPIEEKTLTSCYTMIPSCATPMQPVLSCFFSTPISKRKKNSPTTRTITTHVDNPNGNHYYHHEDEELDPELVAEPVNARSKSFVGTHEYLAPEVISGQGHGGAVDWWTLGVFLYEMIYGGTPFKGDNNEKTLMNILKQPLNFPRINFSSHKEYEEIVKVQDLISKLLVKNPKKRIGSLKGSVEIKRHEFFKGINWALIRSVKPPEVPKDNHHYLHKINSSSSRGLMIVPKLTKKEREAPYQIPHHHFDFF